MSKLISKVAYFAADVLDAVGRGFEVVADAVYDAAWDAEQVGKAHDPDLQHFSECDEWDEWDGDLDEELLG